MTTIIHTPPPTKPTDFIQPGVHEFYGPPLERPRFRGSRRQRKELMRKHLSKRVVRSVHYCVVGTNDFGRRAQP